MRVESVEDNEYSFSLVLRWVLVGVKLDRSALLNDFKLHPLVNWIYITIAWNRTAVLLVLRSSVDLSRVLLAPSSVFILNVRVVRLAANSHILVALHTDDAVNNYYKRLLEQTNERRSINHYYCDSLPIPSSHFNLFVQRASESVASIC